MCLGVTWCYAESNSSLELLDLALFRTKRASHCSYFPIGLVTAYVLCNLTPPCVLSSATKHIQPATTARNPSESAWVTIRSSDSRQLKHKHKRPLQCAFNLHLRRLIIARHLALHRSSHRRPLQLHPRSLSRSLWCRAPTPRALIHCPHPLRIAKDVTRILRRLIRYCEGSILLPEATIPPRELQVPHRDLPRLRFPASTPKSEV